MSTTPAPTPERPWLVADIGGTNARFGLVTAPAGMPERVHTLACADHPDLPSAVTAYLAGAAAPRPVAGCVALAGPVSGDRVRLTNGPWEFSVPETRRRLELEALALVNDFAALSLSLPRLSGSDLRAVGGPALDPGLPMAVLGPGTGLGVAGLVPAGDRWVPVSGEGGHVDLPVVDDREIEVMRLLRRRHGTVSAENVLSGTGLERLHGALREVGGLAAGPAESIRPAQPVNAAEICTAAVAGTDQSCVDTLSMFCALLGGFAGNVALTLGARGGVFLGGGVLPRIADFLDTSDFRRRFEAKPEMAAYVEAIATTLVITPTPALRGAAVWLEQSGRKP